MSSGPWFTAKAEYPIAHDTAIVPDLKSVVVDDDLPEAYALALRLRCDGFDAAGIAKQMGIEPAAVPSLLRLADAKLGRLRGETANTDRIR